MAESEPTKDVSLVLRRESLANILDVNAFRSGNLNCEGKCDIF